MSPVVIKTFETQAHRIIDKNDGIIRVYSKPSHIEENDVRALHEKFSEIRGNERLIVLMDPTEENSMTPEARHYVVKHTREHVSCLTIIGRKKFTRSLFKIFTSFIDIGVEMKMFDSEQKAEKWLFEEYIPAATEA